MTESKALFLLNTACVTIKKITFISTFSDIVLCTVPEIIMVFKLNPQT